MDFQKTVSLRTTSPDRAATRRATWNDYLELTKPRLSLMSVITAVAGYLMAAPQRDPLSFLSVLGGTALAAGGAAAINQWMERGPDGLMKRTQDRPLPAGRLNPTAALIYGGVLCVAGPLILLAGANALASALTALTILTYILIYTPLKRVTHLATEVGALPGALPPLIGWAAAGHGLGLLGWCLFGILFAWQIPHFMAISWMFREDYERGGYRMLSLDEGGARSVALSALCWTAILLLVCLATIRAAGSGALFMIGGPLLCLWFLGDAWRFYRTEDKDRSARRLFFGSIIFLPAFMLTLLVDYYLF